VMSSKLARRDREDEIKCMFRAMDDRGVGYITFPNLKNAFQEIGNDMPQQVGQPDTHVFVFEGLVPLTYMLTPVFLGHL
jgi:hypothetical protein